MGDMADLYRQLEEDFTDYGQLDGDEAMHRSNRNNMKKKKPEKITKRFYVGSNRMATDWPKATLFEAVAHAKRLLDEDPDMQQAIVVQIVRVVRRQSTPLIVEKV